jgi:hypothetical protein
MADSNEDRLLRSALGRTPECLPVERLESPLESLDAPGRAHVERCAYCQNERAMLAAFEDAAPQPEEAAALAWIQSELDRRKLSVPPAEANTLWSKTRAWWQGSFSSRAWQSVPIAAGLLLVVAGGMYLRKGDTGLRPPAGQQVWRSQSFTAITPVGDVTAAPTELQWNAVPGAAKYLVRVMEVDRTEIWRGEATAARIVLPPEIRGPMTPGRSFLWTVTAREVTGGTLAETGLQTFHITATSR